MRRYFLSFDNGKKLIVDVNKKLTARQYNDIQIETARNGGKVKVFEIKNGVMVEISYYTFFLEFSDN